MLSTRKSLIISLAESYLTILLQLLSLFILARLVSPKDFGLFSVASAIILIAQTIRDFGVGSYLIQEKELTHEKIRTAFTITLIFAILFFFIAQIGAGYLADFYNESRVELALRLLAINFLLMPFNSTTFAIMRREMRFDILFWINITSAIFSTTTSIYLALQGYGYLSLVWSSIVAALIFCIGGVLYRRSEFWLSPSLSEWKSVFYFGSRSTFSNILVQVALNINDLVIGRVLGLSSLGILNRAQSVMNLFHRDVMNALRNVAFPAFAKSFREGKDLDKLHTRSVTAVTAIAWPFYAFMALFPLEVLRFLFGAQWDSAAPFVPYYCLAGAVAAGWNLVLPLLTAIGRIDLSTRAELMIQPMRIFIILLCALFFDTELPFVLALLFIYIVTWPIVFRIKQRALKTLWVEHVSGALASAKLTALSMSLPVLMKIVIYSQNVIISEYLLLPLVFVVMAISWIISLRLLDHPLLHDSLVPERVRSFILGRQIKSIE